MLKQFKDVEIYKEFVVNKGEDYAKSILGFTDKKVLPNIDTLYVTCTLEKGDFSKFNSWLSDLKSIEHEEVPMPKYNCIFRPYMGVKKYRYCFEFKEQYNIYFCSKKENDSFPSVYVQIRSFFLWSNGEHKVLLSVKESIENIVNTFGLKIFKFTENRIDYAYHCNFIRNLDKFAYDLKHNSVSHFRRWGQEGTLGDVVETDYISLGRRKSNNLFMRIYNKSKEVIEQGYKTFFFKLWYDNKMISMFDLYVHEKCSEHKSYYKIDYYRLMFYKENGSNSYYLDKVSEMLTNFDKYEPMQIRALADKLVPRITQIVNVEYETKRKFYYSLDSSKEYLNNVISVPPCLESLFKILDNKHLIHLLLTDDIFRVVKDDKAISRKRDRPVSPVWKIIQNTQVNDKELSKEDRRLLRTYQRNMDINRVKRTIISNISSFSLYVNGENERDIVEDTLQFINFMPENDWNKALEIKHKKAPSIIKRIEELENLSIKSGYDLLEDGESFSIINLTDGTIIE